MWCSAMSQTKSAVDQTMGELCRHNSAAVVRLSSRKKSAAYDGKHTSSFRQRNVSGPNFADLSSGNAAGTPRGSLPPLAAEKTMGGLARQNHTAAPPSSRRKSATPGGGRTPSFRQRGGSGRRIAAPSSDAVTDTPREPVPAHVVEHAVDQTMEELSHHNSVPFSSRRKASGRRKSATHGCGRTHSSKQREGRRLRIAQATELNAGDTPGGRLSEGEEGGEEEEQEQEQAVGEGSSGADGTPASSNIKDNYTKDHSNYPKDYGFGMCTLHVRQIPEGMDSSQALQQIFNLHLRGQGSRYLSSCVRRRTETMETVQDSSTGKTAETGRWISAKSWALVTVSNVHGVHLCLTQPIRVVSQSTGVEVVLQLERVDVQRAAVSQSSPPHNNHTPPAPVHRPHADSTAHARSACVCSQRLVALGDTFAGFNGALSQGLRGGQGSCSH